jgi:hypothetical protein
MRALPQVKSPTLIVHSTEDDTASLKNAHFIAERISASRTEMFLVDDTYHVLTLDRRREDVAHRSTVRKARSNQAGECRIVAGATADHECYLTWRRGTGPSDTSGDGSNEGAMRRDKPGSRFGGELSGVIVDVTHGVRQEVKWSGERQR